MKFATVILLALAIFASSAHASVLNAIKEGASNAAETLSNAVGSAYNATANAAAAGFDAAKCLADTTLNSDDLTKACGAYKTGEECPAGCKDAIEEFDAVCIKNVIDKFEPAARNATKAAASACGVNIDEAAAAASGATSFSLAAAVVVVAAGMFAF